MTFVFILTSLLNCILLSMIANSYLLILQHPQSLWLIVPVFLYMNILAGALTLRTHDKKRRICCHGTVLLCAFCGSVIVSVVCQIILAVQLPPGSLKTFVWSLVLCIAVNGIVFWNGIVCVYLTSTQLGFKKRLAGVLCGMIPVANVIALFFIIKTAAKECLFEIHKEHLNNRRKQEKLCDTKYPILLVHGVFFRDTKYFNYWGRIPKELEIHGARIFYGNQASAASIADCARELTVRIRQILAETGAEKVNIIAHSKGGLDSRYAIGKLGIGDCVASLTTINTPHRGCLFADYLLNKIPANIQNQVAETYNSALKKLGESNSDFLAAVNDLTDEHCKQLNTQLPAPEGIFCQSVGSVIPKAASGNFPLNFSYHLVQHFSGENDGLVSESSFFWGEKYILLRPAKKRGISHGDMIDLNRENSDGFDVREFYVNLVNDLKARGL